MEKQRGSDRRERPPKQAFKSFAELARGIRETGDDLDLHIYPSLTFGAVWWIPDEVTGFGTRSEHPWIIVVPYQPGHPVVVACPRTSRVEPNIEKSLLIPGGVIPELERDGIILLNVRRSLLARSFRDYRHAGSLPDGWKQELRNALNRFAEQVGRWSEES